LSGLEHNILQTKLTLTTDPNGSPVSISSAFDFKFEASLENIKVDYAKGYFGSKVFSDNADFTLDFMSKITEGTLDLPETALQISVENGIKVPIRGQLHYLKNTNRKLLYFILDYHQYEKSKTVAMGTSQSNKLQAVLALLDQYGTLEHTDGIYIVVTKSDLFPYGVNQKEYAANFVKDNFKGLITNCKNLQEKYRNKFKIIVYPFSIGDVRFQNMLVNINPESPEMVVEDIIQHSFMTTTSKLKKYFS
jgi:hypothetical protein